MDSLTLPAYAKINICLHVVGKRNDNYHLLKSVMQTIALKDYITVSIISSGIELQVQGNKLPLGEENTAYKAAKAFLKEAEINQGVKVLINKNIPTSAGLGGGSADAAAVLKGLNLLFKTGFHEHKLAYLGTKIGADVPFCVIGGTVLAGGIGEKLQLLPPFGRYPVVLVKPDFEVSTSFIYKNHEFSEEKSRKCEYLLAVKEGDYTSLFKNSKNDLEETAFKYYPEIAEIKEEMFQAGALFSLMCGSGPTVFGIMKDDFQAEKIAKYFNKKYNSVYRTFTE